LTHQTVWSGYRPDQELTVLNYLLFKYPIAVKLKFQIAFRKSTKVSKVQYVEYVYIYDMCKKNVYKFILMQGKYNFNEIGAK